MQNFKTLRQSLLGELAMSLEEREKERREKNAIYSGHLRLCQQPRAAHALRSDQFPKTNNVCLWQKVNNTEEEESVSYVELQAIIVNHCTFGTFGWGY